MRNLVVVVVALYPFLILLVLWLIAFGPQAFRKRYSLLGLMAAIAILAFVLWFLRIGLLRPEIPE